MEGTPTPAFWRVQRLLPTCLAGVPRGAMVIMEAFPGVLYQHAVCVDSPCSHDVLTYLGFEIEGRKPCRELSSMRFLERWAPSGWLERVEYAVEYARERALERRRAREAGTN